MPFTSGVDDHAARGVQAHVASVNPVSVLIQQELLSEVPVAADICPGNVQRDRKHLCAPLAGGNRLHDRIVDGGLQEGGEQLIQQLIMSSDSAHFLGRVRHQPLQLVQ